MNPPRADPVNRMTKLVPQTLAAALALGLAGPATAADWMQWGYDASHMAYNPAETALGAGNVAQLQQSWSVTMTPYVDAAPVFLSGVSTDEGTKDLLFVFGVSDFYDSPGSNETGTLTAYDAMTGASVWSKTTSGSGGHASSSPAIDPDRQYVYSAGQDGKVHKYHVGNGQEVTGGGWPVTVTLKPDQEKIASALTIAATPSGTFLYAVTNGYNGDGGDYQGHLVAINLANASTRVFNAMCSDQTALIDEGGCPTGRMSGIWGRPGATWDAATGRVYVTTGNGDFDILTGGTNWGDSVLALNPDGSGSGGGFPVDSYTPNNYDQLDNTDADLGSISLAIAPAPTGSNIAHLGVQSGKDAMLRLLDLDDLSGQGGPGNAGGELDLISVPQGPWGMNAQPAIWANGDTTWVYVTSYYNIAAIKIMPDDNGQPQFTPSWQKSADAMSAVVANGVVYYADNLKLKAVDAVSGNPLWQSPTISGTFHWQSPIVVNGAVYYATSQRLVKFALPAGDPIFANGFDGS